jgi:hypothetical protein
MASELMLLIRRGGVSSDRKCWRDRAARERARGRDSKAVIRMLVPKAHEGALIVTAAPLSVFD